MIWCGNSPDLNAIEPAWPYLKRQTTKKGAPTSRTVAEERWKQAWKDLPQAKIQAWIEAIPHHIQCVIDCKGGMSTEVCQKSFESCGLPRRPGWLAKNRPLPYIALLFINLHNYNILFGGIPLY